jgi:hypothetical protein
MSDADVPAETLAVIEVIAGAIRDELGGEVDAYPGCQTPEGADPLNRAFRAVVRALLTAAGVPGDDLAALVSRTLRGAAERRLEGEGWGDRVRTLIDDEPGSPDDWLCFLALSSRPQIEPLPEPDDPDCA